MVKQLGYLSYLSEPVSIKAWPMPDDGGLVIICDEGDMLEVYEQDIPKLIKALQDAYDHIQQQKEKQ